MTRCRLKRDDDCGDERCNGKCNGGHEQSDARDNGHKSRIPHQLALATSATAFLLAIIALFKGGVVTVRQRRSVLRHRIALFVGSTQGGVLRHGIPPTNKFFTQDVAHLKQRRAKRALPIFSSVIRIRRPRRPRLSTWPIVAAAAVPAHKRQRAVAFLENNSPP